MESRQYIDNDGPMGSLPTTPRELLISSLEELVQNHPVLDSYDQSMQKGLFSGHTSLAFLLLRVSSLHPDLTIKGYSLQHWAEQYFKPACVELVLREDYAGLHSEKLAVDMIRACLSGREDDVQQFLSSIPAFFRSTEGEDQRCSELLYGRSGVLYMLRLAKKLVPSSSDSIDPMIVKLTDATMEDYRNGGWTFAGKRYLGPSHGDIGIITQLVLSRPSLAPTLTDQLEELLDLQMVDGNWPASNGDEQMDKARVQFCHGAPGFVISLQTLRSFFPDLQERIDSAIAKGVQVVWKRGLLTKEPSICHGILGNALALPVGPQRNHFLAQATFSAVAEARSKDSNMFTKASYTSEVSPFLNYLPSAVWAWAVCEMEHPPIIAYDDV